MRQSTKSFLCNSSFSKERKAQLPAVLLVILQWHAHNLIECNCAEVARLAKIHSRFYYIHLLLVF